MNFYAWMVGVLLVLFLMVMIMGLLSCQEKLPPDEEARLLKLQEEERKRRKEARDEYRRSGGRKG